MADSELSASTRQRPRLDAELRAAIAGGELRLHYQPIVELSTGRTLALS